MISLRKKLKSKWITLFSVAVVIAVMTLAFPPTLAHLNEGYSGVGSVIKIGQGETRIIIGTPVSADTADYTCDGTDDDVQFQAAFDALPASGGQVWVESGTYNWDTTTTVTRAIDNISVIGVGGGVDFNTDDVTAAFQAGGNYWLFSNLQVDAGGIDMGATTDWMWLNVEVNSVYYSVRTDSINIEDHSGLHESGAADAIKLDDLAAADDNTDLDATVAAHGLLPKLGGGTENWLRADGAWAAPAGGGDVSGPASSTDHAIARHDGVGGKTLQDYTSNPPTISDSGDMNVDGDIDVDNVIVSGNVDGVDVSTHSTATTGVHGVGAETILHTGNIGSSIQAYDAGLADIAGLAVTDSNVIVGDGANWVAETGATFRASLGLTIGTDILAEQTIGIADDNLLEVDGSPNDDEYARFTANGLEGRTEAEFKGDFNLQIGTDVLAEQTIGIADDNLLEVDGSPNDDEYARFTANGLEGRTEAEFKGDFNLQIGTDVLAEQTIGIADDNLVEMDDADAADDDYAKITANGLEGRSYSEVLGDLSGQADATFDWNGQTLADWGIESGSTLDATPVTGQFFLHTPTGRNILYQYNGSNWIPIQSFGTMTLYVDSTDGTDQLTDHGHAVDGDAFATVQFAVDCIPGCFGGSVTININDETYAETVTIQGKSPTGAYTITLSGELAQQSSATADSKVAGTGATQGSLTDTGAFGSYDNMLVEITNDDEYRVIDSDTADVVTIAGTFGDAVDLAYIVWDWDTQITNLVVQTGQAGVEVEDLEVTTAVSTYTGAALTMTRCKMQYTDFNFATQVLNECLLSRAGTVLDDTGGYTQAYRTKVICSSDTGIGLYVRDNGILWFMQGSIVDGDAGGGNKATRGIFTLRGTFVNFFSSDANGLARIRNCDTGVEAANAAQAISTNDVTYSNNGDDEDADATTFAYIDTP